MGKSLDFLCQSKKKAGHTFDLLKGANFEGFSLHFGLDSQSVRMFVCMSIRHLVPGTSWTSLQQAPARPSRCRPSSLDSISQLCCVL